MCGIQVHFIYSTVLQFIDRQVVYVFIHDLIKIKFIREGYLPNYPYHMISDEEMCDAFLNHKQGNVSITEDDQYFYYAYPLIEGSSAEVIAAWEHLRKSLLYHIHTFKYTKDSNFTMPDWVYSYMLGSVIGPRSDTLDIHDLISPLYVDNVEDKFGAEQAQACYEVSKKWIVKTRSAKTSAITADDIVTLHLPNDLFTVGDVISIRPATVFGEPHVIKSVRLGQVSPI